VVTLFVVGKTEDALPWPLHLT